MELFGCPTIGFNGFKYFVIIRLDRRDLGWIGVTTNPTAECVNVYHRGRFSWYSAPRYLIRDRDRSTALSVKPDCVPWVAEIIQLPGLRPFRTALRRLTDRSGASVLTTSLVLGEEPPALDFKNYADITTARTPRSLNKGFACLSPGSANRRHISPAIRADFIVNTVGFRFFGTHSRSRWGRSRGVASQGGPLAEQVENRSMRMAGASPQLPTIDSNIDRQIDSPIPLLFGLYRKNASKMRSMWLASSCS